MFGCVAFTAPVGDVDDHWRDHGVNPTRAGSRVRSRRINDGDDSAKRDVRLLIEGSDAYRLTKHDAADVLAHVTRAVGTWREIARKRNIGAAEIEHMASAFRH